MIVSQEHSTAISADTLLMEKERKNAKPIGQKHSWFALSKTGYSLILKDPFNMKQ
jgi:hypothetical protein